MPFFKVFGYDSTRGMNPWSTDCEADALITTPSRRLFCFEDLQFFSIAIDESTGTTDTAELAVFVRGLNKDFHVVENFLELLPMMDTTTGADILKPLLQCLEAMNLNLSKPVSTTTDKAPSMVGKI